MKRVRPTVPARSRRARSTGRPTGLGLRRPAGTHRIRRSLPQRPGKLDLTQLLTLGAVLVSLVFAVPQAINAQATLEATRNQNAIDRQSQLTDRFTTAIDQLGSDKLQVRLGGIYALERIADDSRRDSPTVQNVLATFVREETRKDTESCVSRSTGPRADVQAAVTVLADPHPGWKPSDLTESCLRRADFPGADLRNAKFYGSSLRNAYFPGADLRGAEFGGASLRSATLSDTDLSGADLSIADLSNADLTDANLRFANLRFANLNGTNLRGADLTDANLRNARLYGTDLTDVDLSGADLRGARLYGTDLTDANLRGANLTDTRGLTPAQLRAAAHPP